MKIKGVLCFRGTLVNICFLFLYQLFYNRRIDIRLSLINTFNFNNYNGKMGVINRGKFVHKFIVATVRIIYNTQRVPIKSTIAKLSSKTGMSLLYRHFCLRDRKYIFLTLFLLACPYGIV